VGLPAQENWRLCAAGPQARAQEAQRRQCTLTHVPRFPPHTPGQGVVLLREPPAGRPPRPHIHVRAGDPRAVRLQQAPRRPAHHQPAAGGDATRLRAAGTLGPFGGARRASSSFQHAAADGPRRAADLVRPRPQSRPCSCCTRSWWSLGPSIGTAAASASMGRCPCGRSPQTPKVSGTAARSRAALNAPALQRTPLLPGSKRPP
jgi:hypothetical protein